MVFCYQLITCLKAAGFKVLAVCTDREARETADGNGSITKVSIYRFAGFREY